MYSHVYSSVVIERVTLLLFSSSSALCVVDDMMTPQHARCTNIKHIIQIIQQTTFFIKPYRRSILTVVFGSWEGKKLCHLLSSPHGVPVDIDWHQSPTRQYFRVREPLNVSIIDIMHTPGVIFYGVPYGTCVVGYAVIYSIWMVQERDSILQLYIMLFQTVALASGAELILVTTAHSCCIPGMYVVLYKHYLTANSGSIEDCILRCIYWNVFGI